MLHFTRRAALRLLGGLLLAGAVPMAFAAPPALELVDVYREGVDLSRYWVSEKYDGVRGYWDGHQLWTRGGRPIHAPAWFTAGWPATPLDGELWAGRGRFEYASKTVRAADAGDAAWRRMRYMVFDLPGSPAAFDQRVPAIRAAVARIDLPWVQAVAQFKVAHEAALHAALDAVVRQGGEGLVLHHGGSHYRAGRGVGLLKLKPYEDAEAQVIGVRPGRGRLAGMMGSLRVRTPEGREFSLGSGFSDAQRRAPPAPGTWVTYRFRGRTASGLPRFAVFLRVRTDYEAPGAGGP